MSCCGSRDTQVVERIAIKLSSAFYLILTFLHALTLILTLTLTPPPDNTLLTIDVSGTSLF